jgi:hypothetical protein
MCGLPTRLLDTVTVNEVLRFDQIAEAVGMKQSDVAHLNPMYRLDVIPATVEHWPLVLAFVQRSRLFGTSGQREQHQT